jgi:hypothetical protein
VRREGYSMQSTDNPIATAQREARKQRKAVEVLQLEQRKAARRYIKDGHPLAELGMGDWFAEEFLLTQECQL